MIDSTPIEVIYILIQLIEHAINAIISTMSQLTLLLVCSSPELQSAVLLSLDHQLSYSFNTGQASAPVHSLTSLRRSVQAYSLWPPLWGGNLLSELQSYFAKFLRKSGFTFLGIFYPSICVGFEYQYPFVEKKIKIKMSLKSL